MTPLFRQTLVYFLGLALAFCVAWQVPCPDLRSMVTFLLGVFRYDPINGVQHRLRDPVCPASTPLAPQGRH